jgi:hypothetical protein
VTGIRATYWRVPLVTVTCTVPRATVSLISRNSRLSTVSTQNPTIAITIAHLGIRCSLCQ